MGTLNNRCRTILGTFWTIILTTTQIQMNFTGPIGITPKPETLEAQPQTVAEFRFVDNHHKGFSCSLRSNPWIQCLGVTFKGLGFETLLEGHCDLLSS